MGYTTYFDGSLQIDRPVREEHFAYINTFSRVRHVPRDVEKLQTKYKGEFGLDGDYGRNGMYFAYDDGNFGQNEDGTCVNRYDLLGSPEFVPGYWCHWEIADNRTELQWDEGEKFYNYVEWLQFLIDHFFKKWGYVLRGEITWNGEEYDDLGKIVVKDNVIKTLTGVITYV